MAFYTTIPCKLCVCGAYTVFTPVGPYVALYLQDYLMDQCHIFGDSDPNFDLKINIGHVHGLVILLNIFKIIWWMNIIVCIMDQCDTDWPHQVYEG